MKFTFARRLAAVSTAALLFSGAAVSAASADTVANNLDATVDAVAEVMPLTLGGASGLTQLFVTPANGDGKQGCNLTSNTTLTVSVTSSNSNVASVTPSSATFTSCGSNPTITVVPVGVGTATVSLTQVTNTTGGSFDLSPATFTVTVAAGNTAPVVSITGVSPGASYEFGAVPAAGCSVTDVEDGNSTFPATLSGITGPLSSYGLGEQTASCAYTDDGGLAASASVTYSIVDTTKPVITLLSRTPTANAFGWNKTDVTVTWNCSDDVRVEAETVTTTLSDEGADQSALGTCVDVAGNSASDSVGEINIDKTAPGISWIGGPQAGATYYFGEVPSAPTCTATDELSGPDSCSVTGFSTALGAATLTATATDKAGNTATDTRSYTVKPWDLKGFYQPVDMGGTINTVKAGSTVPLKSEVFGSSERTDLATVSSFKVTTVSCSTLAVTQTDDIEQYSTGSTSLRYDATGGQFIQNWQTPKAQVGTCYMVTMKTAEGSSLVASFRLK